ncbi:unnamed protein product [Paramecium sonneborni]|uniref:Uncharacterized protein n=1 Tax=Paramecium sonneborni TaxID=65129 RepID=A0A8S1QYU4_9CILI|nr:unnamed protein product [Paramecium sonneborni]
MFRNRKIETQHETIQQQTYYIYQNKFINNQVGLNLLLKKSKSIKRALFN